LSHIGISQIHTDVAEIRVLNQDQITKSQAVLSSLVIPASTPGSEADAMLEDLFPALQNFFMYAADEGDFILVSKT